MNYAKAIFNDTIGVPEVALVVLCDAIDKPAVPYWGIQYMDWNDAQGQTEEKVIEVILVAAQRAEDLSAKAANQ